jgi:hypothetical protein
MTPKLIHLFLLLALAACTSTSRQTEPAEDASLVGSWTWIETSGGKMGQVRNPRTEGYGMVASFRSDGSFDFTRDGLVWASGRFETADSTSGPEVRYALDTEPSLQTVISWSGLGTPPRHQIRFDDSGALVLDEGCCDRFMHIFQRDP